MSITQFHSSRTALLVGSLLLLASPVVGYFLPQGLGTTAVQNTILLATGAVVLLYTYETHEMRRQMLRPLVLANVERRDISRGLNALHVILKNIGQGPAIFVHVEDFAVIPDGEGRHVLSIPSVDYIAPGGEVAQPVRQVTEEKGKVVCRSGDRDWDFVAVLNPESANAPYEIMIRYEDINRRHCWSRILMGKGGIRLLDHG